MLDARVSDERIADLIRPVAAYTDVDLRCSVRNGEWNTRLPSAYGVELPPACRRMADRTSLKLHELLRRIVATSSFL